MGRTYIATTLIAAVVMACSPMQSAEPSVGPAITPSAALTVPPPQEPSPSPVTIQILDDEALADVHLQDSGATAVCDPDPSAFGDVFCSDGLEWGLRALRTVMPSVDRLYLNRPACASGTCTPEDVNIVRVIGWIGDDAHTVFLDGDNSTVTVPVPGAAALWPLATSSVPPPIFRPSIKNAATEIHRREPYPYCGRAMPIGLVDDTPAEVERYRAINTCFLDGVLDGRPVEMIEITAVTEKPALFRFDGQGPVLRYLESTEGTAARRWYRAEGPVILGSSVLFGLEQYLSVRVD